MVRAVPDSECAGVPSFSRQRGPERRATGAHGLQRVQAARSGASWATAFPQAPGRARLSRHRMMTHRLAICSSSCRGAVQKSNDPLLCSRPPATLPRKGGGRAGGASQVEAGEDLSRQRRWVDAIQDWQASLMFDVHIRPGALNSLMVVGLHPQKKNSPPVLCGAEFSVVIKMLPHSCS